MANPGSRLILWPPHNIYNLHYTQSNSQGRKFISTSGGCASGKKPNYWFCLMKKPNFRFYRAHKITQLPQMCAGFVWCRARHFFGISVDFALLVTNVIKCPPQAKIFIMIMSIVHQNRRIMTTTSENF